MYLCHYKFTCLKQTQWKVNILCTEQSSTKPWRWEKLPNDRFTLQMKLLLHRVKKNPQRCKTLVNLLFWSLFILCLMEGCFAVRSMSDSEMWYIDRLTTHESGRSVEVIKSTQTQLKFHNILNNPLKCMCSSFVRRLGTSDVYTVTYALWVLCFSFTSSVVIMKNPRVLLCLVFFNVQKWPGFVGDLETCISLLVFWFSNKRHLYYFVHL